jgi:hypothetical protein
VGSSPFYIKKFNLKKNKNLKEIIFRVVAQVAKEICY